MPRYVRFTFLCDVTERQAIADLAIQLHRSQSDAVRFVVVEAAKQLVPANIPASATLPDSDLKLESRRQDGNRKSPKS